MATRHGHGGRKPSSEYVSWVSMKKRCSYRKSNGFNNYGGKGIIVCERWKNSFINFLSDMGPKPTPVHTLDRYPNKTGNYEPGDCRWSTPKEQADNKINRHSALINDTPILISQLPRDSSLKYNTVLARFKRGWAIDKAVNTPKRERIKMGRFGKTTIYVCNNTIYALIYNILISRNIPVARVTSDGLTKSILIRNKAKYKCPDKILSGIQNPATKLILGTNTITNETKTFHGLREAATYLNGAKSNIANVLSGSVKTYKKWAFKHI